MLTQSSVEGIKGKIVNMGDWSIDRPGRDYLPYIVAKGGWQGGSAGVIGTNVAAANTYRQVDPVWEPFLIVRDGKLVTYYSDENDYLGYDPATGLFDDNYVVYATLVV